MAQRNRPVQKLSTGEMEMMSLLWEYDELTLSQAHESMGRPIGYTTVQTRLNRLVEKKLVRRSSDRPARYQAAVEPEAVTANHLNVLLDRVTQGKVVPLVAHLVQDRSVTRSELEELKQIIRDAEDRLGPTQEPK